ncbi:non-ribosomal peptide synthetase, partial [Rhodococcus sp. T7]|uniref:non-ribosomal peptide synthetase n=1 Tax=Rhodococcus sp. T7 TaxID=627444 RepID=UPI0013573609
MSVGMPGQQSLTIEDLPRLISAVADIEPGRCALLHVGAEVTYEVLHQELTTLDSSMGGVLGPDALVPVVLSAVVPGVIESESEGLGGVVDTLIADAVSVLGAAGSSAARTEVPRTLVSLFDEQVAKSPDAVALEFEGDVLTYTEFDARANRLARELIVRGVGPDSLVGLGIRRSFDLLVGMYAVIKAGGAYVPLDPEHPADRLAYVLETARPVAVLTTSRDELELPSGMNVLEIDELDIAAHADTPVIDAERSEPLRADNLAYVIFTSGSTGRPKGVGVSHRAIVSNLRWRQQEYGFTCEDVILQKTPFTFDVSVWELFWPLQVGATLLIAAPDGHRDPAYLARTMIDRGVTAVHFVPSMLSVFVAEPLAAQIQSLRYVFASGEALPARIAARFREISGAALHNLYGPTEAAVDVSYYETSDRDEMSIPIGAPVADTDLLVLDGGLHPVPVGIAGELYLAGAQLARGYVSRPDLTADRFVANPVAGAGERMYRTGDLVRWRGTSENRTLEYIGRTDFQVKLRGLRIELGEIEAALLENDGVSQAVALIHSSPKIGDSLVAYVVPAAGAEFDSEDLASFAARQLPDYMVPALFIRMDTFPLNSSGKLDRNALPKPDFTQLAVEYRAPRTATEEALVKVFGELLDIERLGVDDGFFELGGNSLIATRVVARVNADFGVAVEVREFFDAPTVAQLAGIVDRAAEAGTAARAPLVAKPRPEHVPLSLAQQRMWFLNRFDADSAANNIPVAIRLSGSLDVAALQAAITDVIERHEVLRTIYPEVNGVGYQQSVSTWQAVPNLSPVAVDEARVVSVVTEFASAGFDVTSEVPFRASLLQVAETDFVLVFVVHHISGDGYSIAPLTRDVMAAYASRAKGQEPEWAPLEVQYPDYTLWQYEVLGSENDPESVIAKQEAYWTASLAGLPEQLDLPSDRPRPVVASNRGAGYKFALGLELASALNRLALEHNSTLFMVMHSSLAVLLSRLSGAGDIAVGTPVAGRGDAALDDLVGMFVNTLVLRTEVDASESFVDLLGRVRETDLSAFGHADVPFERLVEVLNPPRSQARHPLFQVMLTFQNMGETSLELPGLSVSGVEFDAAVAKFDLQLTLADAIGVSGEPAGLSAEFTYATDLFDESTVAGFADRFVRVLEAVTVDSAVPVGEIEILDAVERNLVVSGWNDTGHPVDAGASLVSLFDAQVARTPGAVALVFEGEEQTYAEFDARVNRLARYLISVGVGPESLVGLAVRRSMDLLVGMYAVVKAGGGYVPLDPDQPVGRNEYVLETAAPVCVLTTERDGFEVPGQGSVICVDTVDVSGFSG